MSDPVRDPWARFRAATPARIGMRRAGDGWTTDALLDFTLAHARARDAVHSAADFARLAAALTTWETVEVRSRAPDRETYLRRPDLGRRLAPDSLSALPRSRPDIVFVIADGLSSMAVDAHAAPLLTAVRPLLDGLSIGPVLLARQARVALGDEIGEAMGARLLALLVGERPGLSVQDSLGVYVTHGPRVGRSDAERNCISNIHGHGLTYGEAAGRLAWLVREALSRGLTGVGLKEDAPAIPPPAARGSALPR